MTMTQMLFGLVSEYCFLLKPGDWLAGDGTLVVFLAGSVVCAWPFHHPIPPATTSARTTAMKIKNVFLRISYIVYQSRACGVVAG